MYQNLLRTVSISLALAALTAILAACSGRTPADTSGAPSAAAPTPSETVATPQPDDEERPAGWSEESHSNDVDPNYDVVFPTDAINTLTITIAPDDWAAMQADMEDIYASSLYIRKAILAAGPNLSKEEREKLFLQLFASRPTEQAVEAPRSQPQSRYPAPWMPRPLSNSL